jgi:hypothetical protein
MRHLARGERVRVRNGTILTTQGDEDIEWLYDNVPIGTKVYLY